MERALALGPDLQVKYKETYITLEPWTSHFHSLGLLITDENTQGVLDQCSSNLFLARELFIQVSSHREIPCVHQMKWIWEVSFWSSSPQALGGFCDSLGNAKYAVVLHTTQLQDHQNPFWV